MERISAVNILEALKSVNLPSTSRGLNEREKEIADKILNLVKRLEDAAVTEVTDEEELVTITSEEEDDVEVAFEPLEGPHKEFFSYSYIKQVIDFKDSGNISFKTLQHRFKRVKHDVYLSRFRTYLQNMGTAQEKYRIISAYTWNKFLECRARKKAIHDIDIRRWALEKARELQLTHFKASTWWLTEFKKKNKIVSRRVTNFISYRQEVQKDEIERDATAFIVELTDNIFPHFPPEVIFNTDQSGYQYEMHRSRTLDVAGQRSTSVSVESQHSTTHSYTIQPIVSMAGNLLSPLMIVLQEPSGRFGPQISSSLFRPPNAYITCTKSGKVEIQTLAEWTKECLAPNVEDKVCLIIDSFSSHRASGAFEIEDKVVEKRFIPPGATPLVQPLDVFFFRQWKSFVKRFSERVLIDNINVDLHHRNSIIKLHSLIHNQFSAPIFSNMIKYAWKASGFPIDVVRFDHPDKVIFDIELEQCSYSNCCQSAFIQCAYCRKNLCIQHFYNENHYHSPN